MSTASSIQSKIASGFAKSLAPEWNPYQRGRKSRELGDEVSIRVSAGRFITPLESYASSLEINLDKAYAHIQILEQQLKKISRRNRRRR